MESLKHADEILFLDDESVLTNGVYLQPDYLAGKVRCTGPVLRPLRYQRSDGERARRSGKLRAA